MRRQCGSSGRRRMTQSVDGKSMQATDDAATDAAPRLPLNRERVLRQAIVFADAGGLDALRMRRLGQSLGVEAMSLYNHVANKDDLITGMLDLAMAEIALPPPVRDGDWQTAIRATAESALAVLTRHPWASTLMMSPARMSLARLRWMEAVLRTFRQAGFSPTLAHHAYHALDSHIIGFTMWVASIEDVGDLNLAGAGVLERLPAAEFAYLHEHIRFHLHDPAVYPSDDPLADERTFTFTLNLLLDGLARLREHARS